MSLPSAPLAALLACMLSLCLPQPAAAQAEIRIGVLDFLGAEATVDEWSPLLHHLERSLPGHPLSLLQLDHARMRAAVTRKGLRPTGREGLAGALSRGGRGTDCARR